MSHNRDKTDTRNTHALLNFLHIARSFRRPALRTRRSHSLLCPFVFITLGAVLQIPQQVNGQPLLANGIQPLVNLEQQPLHQLIPMNIRPLLLPQEQEQFLQELEGRPPNWQAFLDLDLPEQSERLFQLNRARDEARLTHQNTLQQPIAFLWAGLLRRYLPEYHGFLVALGPEFTSTSWGIIRFKPMGLPDDLVAVPSPESAKQLLVRQQNGEPIEIGVLFFGTLVADEALIYSFSHDQKEDGMIMPVVQIEDVRYFLSTPNALSN